MSEKSEALVRLRAAPWLKSAPLRKILAALDGEGATTLIVGGAVRDTLLGSRSAGTEIDLATTLLPEEVATRARAHGIAAIPTGIDFGTMTLAFDEKSFEVTTLRHDVETDGRHAVVRFGTDWAEDAKRRDFTLNALYCSADGELRDPLDGLEDCLAGRVRFIGDAATRIAEDRLRVFRFFRFSASHGGEVFDPAGLKASIAAAGTLGRLSAERIGHEMTRILALPKCARTLTAMTEAGILDIDGRTLDRLRHYERIAEVPGLAGRLALLTGSDGLDALKSRWRLSNALVRQAQSVGQAAGLIAADRLAEAAYRFADLGDAASDVAAAEADWPDAEARAIRQKLAAYAPPDFPISGATLLGHGFAPGPDLGALMSRLEAAWINSGYALTRDELLALARRPRD